MKHTVYLLLASVLLLAGCDNAARAPSVAQLDELRGQWVVINYWAKWCTPCIKEIPELNQLDQRYPQVTVVGVNYDGATGEVLTTQIQALGIEFASLPQDPAPALGAPRPLVLPTTIILNPQGQISATLVGPQTLASLAQATGQLAPPVPDAD